jgi:hypothetical protein
VLEPFYHKFLCAYFHKDAQIYVLQIWAKFISDVFSILKAKSKTGGIDYGNRSAKNIFYYPVQTQKISHINNSGTQKELSSAHRTPPALQK